MLMDTGMHAVVACADQRRLPKKIEFYYAAGKPSAVMSWRRRECIGNGRVLLLDVKILDMPSGNPGRAIESPMELKNRVLGILTDDMSNPAGISRIALFAEHSCFAAELRPDGSCSEVQWHGMGPWLDFPGYKKPDGSRFRERPDGAWTETDDPWGFTEYSWDETH